MEASSTPGKQELSSSEAAAYAYADAVWARNPDLFVSLQHTPWILLPFEFDPEACLREARALFEEFVVHRSFEQSSANGAKWKSLALRSVDGDPTKTEAAKEYGLAGMPHRNTTILERCPETLTLLHRITKIDDCSRIRFMLLEPGAEIHTHSDAPDRALSLAVNIAFNMPEGCEFWADMNPDGTKNPYSRKIPIRAGSVFLFNTATYHKVVNHSDIPRIHLIIHGPPSFSKKELTKLARAQNGFLDLEDAKARLALKKSELSGLQNARA